MGSPRALRLSVLGIALALCAQVLVLVAGPVRSAPGQRDPAFGTDGLVRTDLGGHEGGRGLVALPDGKVVVAGAANEGDTTGDFLLLRYLPNGLLDPSFGTGGKVVTNLGGKDKAKALVRRPNGHLIAAGASCVPVQNPDQIQQLQGITENCNIALVGYRPDGSLDPAFGTAGVVTTDLGGPKDLANAVVLQPEGKLVVGGRRGFVHPPEGGEPPTSNDDFAVVRYMADGSPDAAFGALDLSSEQAGVVLADFGGQIEQVHDVVVQPDGKIVAAGDHCNGPLNHNLDGHFEDMYTCFNHVGGYALLRYSPDGVPDPSFGAAGRVLSTHGTYAGAFALVLQPADNKLLVGGTVCPGRAPDGVSGSCDFAVARHTPEGVLDHSFGTAGVAMTDFDTRPTSPGSADAVRSLVLEPDGKVVAFGVAAFTSFGNPGPPRFALARYRPDGTLDTSFGLDGRVLEQEAGDPGELVLRPDGRLFHTAIARITPSSGKDVLVAGYLGDPVPVIASVEGSRTSPFTGNDSTPTIVVEGLTPGHTLKVFDGTREALSRQVSAESMTLNATEADAEVVLTTNGEHVLSARATSPSGQVSPPSREFVYVLDPALATPSLSIDDVRVLEGDEGTTDAVFTVTRSSPGSTGTQQLDARFTTVDGSATSPLDYGPTAGWLTFLPGQLSVTVTVAVIGESAAEDHEHFLVRLTEAPSATIAKADGRGVIVDDDRSEPVVTAVSPPAGRSGGGTKVTISGTGLNDATSVSFGDQEASGLSFVSDTEITAISPPHPQGTAEVLVTTLRGRSDDSFDSSFFYGPGAWSPSGSLDEARTRHTATLLDGPSCRRPEPASHCGKVLIAGGDSSNFGRGDMASAELFDPHDGTWEKAATMAKTRTNHTATLLDGPECHGANPPGHCGKVLVVGGVGDYPSGIPKILRHPNLRAPLVGSTAVPTAELYDPNANTWTPAPGPMLDPRVDHTATLLSGPNCGGHCGKVLIAGGAKDLKGHAPMETAEIFDPVAGSFFPTGALDACGKGCEARSLHAAAYLPSGEVLVAGGLGYKLSPGVPRPPTYVLAQPTTVGHFGSRALNSAQIYNVGTGTWRATSQPMAIGRLSPAATVLGGKRCETSRPPEYCGKVLISGGMISGGNLETPIFTPASELLDTTTGTWEPTASMRTARGGHTATLLPNGTVLVVGRNGTLDYTFGVTTTTTEFYDPAARDWRYSDNLSVGRGVHTATLLDGPSCSSLKSPPSRWCGSVLIAGGLLDGDDGFTVPVTAAAEMYTPAPQIVSMTPSLGKASGGTEVVVDGWWLTEGLSKVTFDGVAASFGVEPNGRISAVAPAHAPGAVEVALVNAGGTSAATVPGAASRFVYVGAPGAITDLVATPLPAAVSLSFTSPDDGTTLAPATRYVVKQSTSPIEGDAGFAEAPALCGGVCSVKAANTVELAIGDLEPETTYYYAVQALSAAGEPGPIARVSTTTLAAASAAKAAAICGPSAGPGAGQISYPGGRYSLVGLPPASVLGTAAPLYSWIDQGAGGSYSTFAGGIELEAGHGYWAWFACDGIATLGAGQSSVTMALGAYHASMVGNPSATGPAVVSGHDFAARWDPDANAGAGGYAISGYREPQSLALGEGTWVFSYVPTTVAIDASP